MAQTTMAGAPAELRHEGEMSNPAYVAFKALQIGFVVAPIVAGIDKFTNVLTDWTAYLAPWVMNMLPMTPGGFMMLVGVIEIAAGIIVAMRPKIGGIIVSIWLLAIIVNLLMIPGYYDIALRDLGLAIGAFALSRLALAHERTS